MEKIDENVYLFSHTDFPLWFQIHHFPIFFFSLKGKPHREIIMRLAETIRPQTICYMGPAPSSSPEKEVIIQYAFECLLSGRMLNRVEWEVRAVHLPYSGSSVFIMSPALNLVLLGGQRLTVSSLLCTKRSDQWGMGWVQTPLSTSQRAKPEFNILVKDWKFNVVNVSKSSLGYAL